MNEKPLSEGLFIEYVSQIHNQCGSDEARVELCKYLIADKKLSIATIAERDKRRAERDARQMHVADWCEAAFGKEQQASVPQRALRLLEEAIEAYQAAGCSVDQGHKLLDFVFSRPVGKLPQEIGGVSICLLALSEACGCSAEAEEVREIERVLAKPLAHFTERDKAKNDAGFEAMDHTQEPVEAPEMCWHTDTREDEGIALYEVIHAAYKRVRSMHGGPINAYVEALLAAGFRRQPAPAKPDLTQDALGAAKRFLFDNGLYEADKPTKIDKQRVAALAALITKDAVSHRPKPDVEAVARQLHSQYTCRPWIALGEEAAPLEDKRSYWLGQAQALIRSGVLDKESE